MSASDETPLEPAVSQSSGTKVFQSSGTKGKGDEVFGTAKAKSKDFNHEIVLDNGEGKDDSDSSIQQLLVSNDEAKAEMESPSGSGVGERVMLSNIPISVTEEELRKELNAHGKLGPLFYVRQARGWAMATFSTKGECDAAIAALHGSTNFKDAMAPLSVHYTSNDTSGSPPGHATSSASSLPSTVASTMVPSTAADVPTSRTTPPSKAVHGAVTVAPGQCGHETADTAWHTYYTAEGRPYYHNCITNTRQWKPPTSSSQYGPPGANLFIFYVPSNWTDANLIENFEPFGRILSAKIQRDSTGRNVGYAFVSYDSPQAACQAVFHMDGAKVQGRHLKVGLKKGEEYLLPPELTRLIAQRRVQRSANSSGPMGTGNSYAPFGRRSSWSQSHGSSSQDYSGVSQTAYDARNGDYSQAALSGYTTTPYTGATAAFGTGAATGAANYAGTGAAYNGTAAAYTGTTPAYTGTANYSAASAVPYADPTMAAATAAAAAAASAAGLAGMYGNSMLGGGREGTTAIEMAMQQAAMNIIQQQQQQGLHNAQTGGMASNASASSATWNPFGTRS